MADSAEGVVSEATAEVQAQAESMGWIPPKRFRGEADRFIDADEYVARSEHVLPVVRKQNKELNETVARLQAEGQQTVAALKAAQEAIQDMQEVHSAATVKAAEKARSDLKAQLVAASEAGDHEGIAELTDQMLKLTVATEAPKPKEREQAKAPTAYVMPAEQKAWNEENPWFGTDKRRTALALGIAQELRENGETATGRAFFELVKEGVEEVFVPKEAPASKVEGARGSGGGGGGAGKGKTYASLPADAKAACEADIDNFVGDKKRYKTVDAWRARFTQIYFQD